MGWFWGEDLIEERIYRWFFHDQPSDMIKWHDDFLKPYGPGERIERIKRWWSMQSESYRQQEMKKLMHYEREVAGFTPPSSDPPSEPPERIRGQTENNAIQYPGCC